MRGPAIGVGSDRAANVGSDRLGSAAAKSATDRIVTAFGFKTHTPNAIQIGLSLGPLLQRRSQSGVTARGESKWQELVVWPRSPKRNSPPNKARARLGFSRGDDKYRRTRACERRHALEPKLPEATGQEDCLRSQLVLRAVVIVIGNYKSCNSGFTSSVTNSL